MSKEQLVSIILPTFNGSRYIRHSIESCLQQTYKNIELIVVDDCSNDSTPEMIKYFTDSRLRYVRNDKNQRLPRSLNIGFALAQGEYLTWTSDDNFYLPPAIERMVKTLQDSQRDFVYTDIFAFKDDDWPNAEPVKLDDAEKLNKSNCIRASFLYTRWVRDTVGPYDPDMELIEDYDFWVRVSQRTAMHHLKEPLYYYRYHDQQLYTARNREIKIIEYLFRAKYDFMPLEQVGWYIRELLLKELPGVTGVQLIYWKVNLKMQIEKILGRFKAGKSSFTEARKALFALSPDQGKKAHQPQKAVVG